MALSREQIRARHSQPKRDSWVSPSFGDGGWHATPGCERFDPATCEPRNDRILVEYLEEVRYKGAILLSDNTALEAVTRKVRVVKVGPGKWVEGVNGGLVRATLELEPGDIVLIGPHVDWQSQDGKFAICMQADVRGWTN